MVESGKTGHVAGPNAVDITPKQDGGILKEIIKEGIGNETPAAGSKMSVHYVGTLLDGTPFDSSRGRGEPFEFNLGKGSVIKAWDIGVATMKKGEIAVLTCKSDYAYGANGSPPKIPADATLVFEVEVLGWTGEDLSQKKDEGIIRYIIEKGTGYTTPNDGAFVEVHLIGKYEGKQFEERDVSFPLGEGSVHGVCDGLEKAIEKFKEGEKSRILLKPKYVFQGKGNQKFGIPPAVNIEYEVTLKKFEKAKESWSMDAPEKIEEAKLFKDKGAQYFKDGNYSLALNMYQKMVTFIETDTGFENEIEATRKSLFVVGNLNIAMCQLKLEQFIECRDSCDKALETEPENLKGLFRRGQANLGLGEPEKAKVDFEMVVKLEPTNKAAANQVIICNKALKEQRGKEKQIYANMFEKFAQRDREDPNKLLAGWWDDGKILVEEEKIVPIIRKKKKFELPKRPVEVEETSSAEAAAEVSEPEKPNDGTETANETKSSVAEQ